MLQNEDSDVEGDVSQDDEDKDALGWEESKSCEEEEVATPRLDDEKELSDAVAAGGVCADLNRDDRPKSAKKRLGEDRIPPDRELKGGRLLPVKVKGGRWKFYWVDQAELDPAGEIKRLGPRAKVYEVPADTDAGLLARAMDVAGPWAYELLRGRRMVEEDTRRADAKVKRLPRVGVEESAGEGAPPGLSGATGGDVGKLQAWVRTHERGEGVETEATHERGDGVETEATTSLSVEEGVSEAGEAAEGAGKASGLDKRKLVSDRGEDLRSAVGGLLESARSAASTCALTTQVMALKGLLKARKLMEGATDSERLGEPARLTQIGVEHRVSVDPGDQDVSEEPKTEDGAPRCGSARGASHSTDGETSAGGGGREHGESQDATRTATGSRDGDSTEATVAGSLPLEAIPWMACVPYSSREVLRYYWYPGFEGVGQDSPYC